MEALATQGYHNWPRDGALLQKHPGVWMLKDLTPGTICIEAFRWQSSDIGDYMGITIGLIKGNSRRFHYGVFARQNGL